MVVNDRQIDAILKAAHAPQEEDMSAAPLQRIVASIQPSLDQVRPLRSTRELVGMLFLVCMVVAFAGAAHVGFYGFAKMNLLTRAITFLALGLLVLLAATEFVHEMIPGSLRRLSPVALLGICGVVLVGVFALLFRDPGMDHFVSVGVRCLLAGFLLAVPAGLLSWLVLRRGFAVKLFSAGLAAGTLGGLAGVALLEMHCANFQSAHVLVWHVAVVPVSAVAGGLVGYLSNFMSSLARPHAKT
jgi:hypothetical protein